MNRLHKFGTLVLFHAMLKCRVEIPMVLATVLLLAGCGTTSGVYRPGKPESVHDANEVEVWPVGVGPKGNVEGVPAHRLPSIELDKSAKFDSAWLGVQPWLRGDRKPPVSLVDLGLRGRLKLLMFGGYLGGERKGAGFTIVIADSKENCIVLEWSAVNFYNGLGEAIIVGGTYPSPELVIAKPGSESFQFLFSLIWSFASDERYQLSSERLERMRKALLLSEEQFEEFLLEPEL